MNITQIQENLQKLIKKFNKDSFIYDLLLAYGLPKATVTRLRSGDRNLSSPMEWMGYTKLDRFVKVLYT